jgi:hypothetical protein
MSDSDNNSHKPLETEERRWTREDEENALLEVSEERRLRRLGIDPDADSLTILLELKRRWAEIQRDKDEKE